MLSKNDYQPIIGRPDVDVSCYATQKTLGSYSSTLVCKHYSKTKL